MLQEDVIRKIQKLLNLADTKRNTSEEEASSAAAMAQKLLDQHNLTVSEIGTPDEKKKDGIKSHDGVFQRNNLRQYQTSLFNGLAKQFDCHCFIRSHRINNEKSGKAQNVKSLCVVGHAADVEVFKYTFEYLLEAVEGIYKIAIKEEDAEKIAEMGEKMTWAERRQYRLSFCLGAVHRILGRMDNERKRRMKKDKACTAMVLVRGKEVAEWIDDNLVLKKGRASQGERTQGNAYNAGHSQAGSISLNKGVGSGSSGSKKKIG